MYVCMYAYVSLKKVKDLHGECLSVFMSVFYVYMYVSLK